MQNPGGESVKLFGGEPELLSGEDLIFFLNMRGILEMVKVFAIGLSFIGFRCNFALS